MERSEEKVLRKIVNRTKMDIIRSQLVPNQLTHGKINMAMGDNVTRIDVDRFTIYLKKFKYLPEELTKRSDNLTPD